MKLEPTSIFCMCLNNSCLPCCSEHLHKTGKYKHQTRRCFYMHRLLEYCIILYLPVIKIHWILMIWFCLICIKSSQKKKKASTNLRTRAWSICRCGVCAWRPCWARWLDWERWGPGASGKGAWLERWAWWASEVSWVARRTGGSLTWWRWKRDSAVEERKRESARFKRVLAHSYSCVSPNKHRRKQPICTNYRMKLYHKNSN